MDERAWKFVGDAPTGESEPFYVLSGDLGGVAKPREKTPPRKWPRAAIEKICADLAYELKLPVPPVTLWKASRKLNLLVSLLAVSLIPFEPAVAWNQNAGNLIFTEEESGLVRTAHIDFSNSLFFGFSQSSPDIIEPVRAYPDAGQLWTFKFLNPR